MRAVLLAFSLLSSSAAFAQQAPAGEPQSITVTGIRIQDYRDRLAACLARHCPTNEDADATLALAEALFLHGDYAEGRDAVQSSLRRNHDQARAFPEPVSDLYRAHARLSRHLGFDSDARRSAYGILSALREGIPTEDYRHFTARLELSEMLMQAGNANGARRELAELVRVAHAAGREDVATVAELRMLWFQLIAEPQGSARGDLIRMSQLTAPADRMRAAGAKLILARLYRSEGQTARADALLAEVGHSMSGGGRRRLITAPAYALQVQDQNPDSNSMGETLGVSNVLNRLSDNFEDKWIDVGFWVMPDGHVSGLEVMRQSTRPDWANPLLNSIRGRVYSTGPEATYRLERYTYTAGYERVTGTNIQRRSRAARVEYLDLTAGETPPGPPPAPEPPASN
jgi:tetratricopeptide (TPR) repeat protein